MTILYGSFNLFLVYDFQIVQVYLVTGGTKVGLINTSLTSSTEILIDGASLWTKVGSLPTALYGVSGVSLKNKIIMTGKNNICYRWIFHGNGTIWTINDHPTI